MTTKTTSEMKTNEDFHQIDQQASTEFQAEEWSETCQACNGHGTIVRMKSAVPGFVYTPETCENCNGTGEVHYENPQHGKNN